MFIHRYKTVKEHLLNGEALWWYQECSWCGKRRIMGWSHLDIENKNWLDENWVKRRRVEVITEISPKIKIIIHSVIVSLIFLIGVLIYMICIFFSK